MYFEERRKELSPHVGHGRREGGQRLLLHALPPKQVQGALSLPVRPLVLTYLLGLTRVIAAALTGSGLH